MTTTTDDGPALPGPETPTGPVNRYGQRGALTRELQDKIVQVVSAGNYLKTAAQFAGVGANTLSVWLSRGRAAAAAVEAHGEGRLYCTECDHDRTTELTALREEQARLDAERQAEVDNLAPGEEEPAYVGIVPNRCPSCGTDAIAAVWTLPAAEVRYLEFLQAVTQAETVAEVAAVTHWRRAFQDDWRAARDYLGRKRPDQWAAKTTVAISSEEAEARIERATFEALTALGVDTEGMGLDDLDGDSGEPADDGIHPVDF